MAENNFNIMHARTTFKNIPIHKLTKYSFKDVQAACEAFKKIDDVSECVIIQTASRVEIFLVVNLETDDIPDARRVEGQGLTTNQLIDTWKSLTELDQYDIDHFDQTLEVYKNVDVYHNLLRLACGLDSVVVGKEEVLNQIKDSISSAKLAKVSGNVLNKLFDTVIRVATTIRESTQISKDVVSIGDLAVKLVEEKAGIDAKKRVLLIGTGETAARVAKALNRRSYAFEVTSQTLDRAVGFSEVLGGKPIDFKEVLSGFDKFDIVIVATTADYFVINHDKLRLIMAKKTKGTLILDVSDPRAVDERVSSFPGMKLMFRDQVSEMYEEIVQATQKKIPDVEKAIHKELPIVEATMNRLEAEPTISEVLASVDSIRKKELEKALESLGDMDDAKIKIIDELTKSVVQNIISNPDTSDKKSEQEDSS